MVQYFKDYYWKNGFPHGKANADQTPKETDISYKIVSDPYHKRISIEKYLKKEFLSVIYDSYMLDFRSLKNAEQLAWEKILLFETTNKATSLIRNQDDRILYIENSFFEGDYCKICQVTSPQGYLLSVHKMFYKILKDPFDGVILFDQNEHPVMCKIYEVDLMTGEFTALIKEEWNFEKDNYLLGRHHFLNKI
jgi:hypothetical protein